jgi:hypothetical protein
MVPLRDPSFAERRVPAGAWAPAGTSPAPPALLLLTFGLGASPERGHGPLTPPGQQRLIVFFNTTVLPTNRTRAVTFTWAAKPRVAMRTV